MCIIDHSAINEKKTWVIVNGEHSKMKENAVAQKDERSKLNETNSLLFTYNT